MATTSEPLRSANRKLFTAELARELWECNGNREPQAEVKDKSSSTQKIVNNCSTIDSPHDKNKQLESRSKDVSAREVAIQANDYDIERTSGHLPARKRYIPLKFSDYRIFAGGTQTDEKEDEEEEETEDATFEPDKNIRKAPKTSSGRGRGRPRKNAAEAPAGTKQEGTEKKTAITKVPAGFKCGICGRIFSLRGNAKAHIITHTDQKPFSCDYEGCGKQLRSKESLRRHQLSHLGIKMFECSDCKKKFSSNASLQEHMARHTGAKPLSCNVCGCKFRQVAVLKRHIITHSEEKPFACGVCGRRFAMKVYVQSHMKTHTGERPFTCDTCNKSFAHASDLNRHKIIHTGRKPYPCSVCSLRYSDASSRRRHEREHQSQYMCHLCDQHFTRAGQLRSHLLREHNTDMETLFEVQVVDKPSQNNWSGSQPKVLNILQNMPSNIVVQQVDVLGQTSDSLVDIVHTTTPMQVLMGASQLGQSSGNSRETTEVVGQAHDPKLIPVSEPPASLETIANLQPGCTYRIIGHDDTSQIYEIQLDDGSHIPFEELANRINLGDINLQTNEGSLTLIKQEDNSYTVIQQQQHTNVGVGNPPDQMTSEHCQLIETSSQQLQNTNNHKTIPEVDEKIILAEDVSSASLIKSENTDMVNIYNEDTTGIHFISSSAEKSQLPEIKVETMYIPAVQPETLSNEAFIYEPDLSSQEYYNWLSTFTEKCKLLPMPLERSTFQKISHVQKTLSDFMASPSGVISDKNNFKVLMSITHDLSDIIARHLALMLQNLS